MKKEIKVTLISALLALIIQLVSTTLFSFWLGNNGELIFSSSKIQNGYLNTIILKNMQSNMYLKNIDIIVDSNIDIVENDNLIGNAKIEDNKITIDEINPKETVNLTFITTKKLEENNIKIINSAKIGMEYFNDKQNISQRILILSVIYFIINFLVSYFFNNINKKEKEKLNIRVTSAEKKMKELEDDAEKFHNEIITKAKNLELLKQVYLNDIKDMEKEVCFYRRVILKKLSKQINKKEIEGIILKIIKNFSKKNHREFNYSHIDELIKILELNDDK